MAAMRKKERNGPGMATSSSEDEESPLEDCVPVDCCAGTAGGACRASEDSQQNADRRIETRIANEQWRDLMAKILHLTAEDYEVELAGNAE
jgi:hypothetical protein